MKNWVDGDSNHCEGKCGMYVFHIVHGNMKLKPHFDEKKIYKYMLSFS